MTSVQRPTLPPLKSLLLPTPMMVQLNPRRHSLRSSTKSTSKPYTRRRQVSISSSVTSTSRTPSLSPPPLESASSSFSTQCTLRTPSPSPPPQIARSNTRSPRPSHSDGSSSSDTFRLVPTALCQADAILFVPPPISVSTTSQPTRPNMSQLSSVPSISRLSRHSLHRQHNPHHHQSAKALLLVGPAMNHLKGPDGVRKQIALGARIHPYKIVRNGVETASGLQHKTTPLVPVRDISAVGLCN